MIFCNNLSKLELWLGLLIVNSAMRVRFLNFFGEKISLWTTSLRPYFYCPLNMYVTSDFCLFYFLRNVIFNHSHNPISFYHFLINERFERWTSRNVMFCNISTVTKWWPVAEIWSIGRFSRLKLRNLNKISGWGSNRSYGAIFLILRYSCNQWNYTVVFLSTFWKFNMLILTLNQHVLHRVYRS